MEVNTSISPSPDMQRKSRLLTELGIPGGFFSTWKASSPSQRTGDTSEVSNFQFSSFYDEADAREVPPLASVTGERAPTLAQGCSARFTTWSLRQRGASAPARSRAGPGKAQGCQPGNSPLEGGKASLLPKQQGKAAAPHASGTRSRHSATHPALGNLWEQVTGEAH